MALTDEQITYQTSLFFQQRENAGHLIRTQPPGPDYELSWIAPMLDRSSPHDDDYIVLSGFRNPNEVILDVGANYGYSAASIWAAGSHSKVVSFEVIPQFAPALEKIKKLRPKKFDFYIVGLGSRDEVVTFVIPVVDGTPCSALTTADPLPDVSMISRNINSYIRNHHPGGVCERLEFFTFDAPIRPLDAVLRDVGMDREGTEIGFIKLDAEGYEAEIIRGATKTIAHHKPLIMAENGDRQPVREVLHGQGYVPLFRSGAILSESDCGQFSPNYFFGHPTRFQNYRKRDLLR